MVSAIFRCVSHVFHISMNTIFRSNVSYVYVFFSSPSSAYLYIKHAGAGAAVALT